MIERFCSSQEGFRRLRAASDFLDAQKVTKEPLGGGSGWALRAHIRRPLEPHYGGRATGRFLNISGAQNLSGLCDSSRATSSSRISYPSLRPAGQSSLTPSLLLSNANPLRWALRWGPPSAACWTENFEWCGSKTAPGFDEPTLPARSRRRGDPCGRPRAGLGQAPTERPESFPYFVGAAHWAAWERPDGGIGPYKKSNAPSDTP